MNNASIQKVVLRIELAIGIMCLLTLVGVFGWKLYQNHTQDTDPYLTERLWVNGFSLFVRVPGTKALQEKGLGGITSLPADWGMYWHYNPAQMVTFWMKGMKIPLDFIWIKDSAVVGITPDVPPPSSSIDVLPLYRPPSAVDRVLEVNAGFAKLHDLGIGTKITEFAF